MRLTEEPEGKVAVDFVIQARGLTKTFKSANGTVHALGGVDLDVTRGTMLVLLGPSGCGKTTLLRCIGGLENPTDGVVQLSGRTVTSVAGRINVPPEHRNLGMMFQSYGLWPHMTVFDNVAYPLRNRGSGPRREIQHRVFEMLETMGVGDLMERYPSQLSGGQQQRVALARALVASPTALLFDEPLSNVDAQVRKRLRDEIRQMKESQGFAGVYVTHDQEEAMALADVLAVMERGRIRQMGHPWDIYRRPATLYVANFIGEANTLKARVVEVNGKSVVTETEFGRLLTETAGPPPNLGERGHVIVRPEDFVLGSHAEANSGEKPNAHRGTVIGKMLLGPHVELRIEIADVPLRAWASSMLLHDFAVGQPVSVRIAPRSVVWIKD